MFKDVRGKLEHDALRRAKMDSIQKTLRQMADPKTAAFTSRIIPNVDPKSIVGVRTPALRAFAKTLKAGEPQTQKFLWMWTLSHRVCPSSGPSV